jgi:hypothetical protein
MGVFNAGLPSSSASSSSGNLPIGAQLLMVPTAQIINFSDGSVWLQSGNGVSPASYPDAAKLDHVCTHGAAANLTASAQFATTTQVASDGNGTVIATRGVSNQVLRSSDYGATWVTVSITALTNTPLLTSVVWTGSRFIVGGTITGATNTAAWAHSTDGWNWIQGTADTTLGSVSSDAMSMAVNPSTGTVIAVLGNSQSGQSIQRCTTGSTFSRIASVPLSSYTGCAVAYGNGYFVVVSQATYYSTDDGQTWTAGGSITQNSGNANVAYVNGVFVASSNVAGNVYYTATNPTTWTQRSIGGLNPSSSSLTAFNNGSGIASDGTRLVVCGAGGSGQSNFFWATSDGITWRKRHIATGQSTSQAWKPAFAGRGAMLLLPSSIATAYNRTASLVTPDFVGVPYTVSAQGSSDANTTVLYTRIK